MAPMEEEELKKVYRATTTAPVNIAIVKYWGKRDPKLNLPTNSSISVTLSQSDLRTLTTASTSPNFSGPDTLLLNGQPQDIASSTRTIACLSSLRRLRSALEDAADPSIPPLSRWTLKLVSSNNFPTAAGLASSAAGFAALVRAVADLYALPQSAEELSRIARQGSGSACRSLLGGYVAWRAGEAADGSDSLAEEVAPVSHWPSMRALILVVSAAKKDIPSTEGMQATVRTSQLFETRASVLVPRRMDAMEAAIRDRDFATFAELTMRDSNNFHACCGDTWPPIFYLNDVSRAAIRLVENINKKEAKVVAAYTFDAGPNAVIYYLEEHGSLVAGTFRAILGDKAGWEGERGSKIQKRENWVEGLDARAVMSVEEGVSRVILTAVGEGPCKMEDHLVDEDGEVVPGAS